MLCQPEFGGLSRLNVDKIQDIYQRIIPKDLVTQAWRILQSMTGAFVDPDGNVGVVELIEAGLAGLGGYVRIGTAVQHQSRNVQCLPVVNGIEITNCIPKIPLADLDQNPIGRIRYSTSHAWQKPHTF